MQGIPINYYSTFIIEEKFGFNKRLKTFLADILKGTLMSILIGGLLLAVAILPPITSVKVLVLAMVKFINIHCIH